MLLQGVNEKQPGMIDRFSKCRFPTQSAHLSFEFIANRIDQRPRGRDENRLRIRTVLRLCEQISGDELSTRRMIRDD